jgi:hypothetical protein
MDESLNYGQQNFNLPHDVIKLPSKGLFYKPKKESLKVGYLTANDENILMSQNIEPEDLIKTLLRNKIYEPGFDIDQMINGDIQAVLLFLRNTSFGPEYSFNIKDPKTNQYFDVTILLDKLELLDIKETPDEEGLFTFILPKSNKNVKFKILNLKDEKELSILESQYPKGMVAPIVTKKLEMQIVEIDGSKDRSKINKEIIDLPIVDSKSLRKFMDQCQPKLDLKRVVKAPSGENVTVNVSFGVDFFRPFFE